MQAALPAAAPALAAWGSLRLLRPLVLLLRAARTAGSAGLALPRALLRRLRCTGIARLQSALRRALACSQTRIGCLGIETQLLPLPLQPLPAGLAA